MKQQVSGVTAARVARKRDVPKWRDARPTLREQQRSINQAAKALGLTIRPSREIHETPYRAMNPEAAKLLDQRCPTHAIVYDSVLDTTRRRQVMDTRHEVIEAGAIRALARHGVPKKRRYPIAHKMANRFQRVIGAENMVRLSR